MHNKKIACKFQGRIEKTIKGWKYFWKKKDQMLLVAYRDKGLFGCISSLCKETNNIRDKANGHIRPKWIALYNHLMKGVDQIDQNISYYGYPHRFLK